MSVISGFLLGVALLSALNPAVEGQASDGPDTVLVKSGPLTLRAVLWRPRGNGPFPAVLFNHAGYVSGDTITPAEPALLGPVFARHGFVFLFLFRRGVGPSANQGMMEGDVMVRAQAAGGQAARNSAQLELLEGELLNEAAAALGVLRTLPQVDVHRIAVVGHSFGGSLALLLAARDTALRAAVIFGGAAGSWVQSPPLRQRLVSAVGLTTAPVLFIHAANDYSVAPGEVLAREMKRLGKPHQLKIYRPFGRTSREGHNLVYGDVHRWEHDVFNFLVAHTGPVVGQQTGIVGTWRGTSTCADKVAFPACNDEEVIYDVQTLATSADSVTVKADKIVNGQREFMGEIHFGTPAPGEWRAEFQTARYHSRWTLNITGDRMTGTLVDLPSGKLVRRVSLRRAPA